MPRKLQHEGLTPAVIYACYFSAAQKDESIEQQIEACRDYAQRNGIHIVAIYADRAMSGRTDRRPEFQKMLRHAENGGEIVKTKVCPHCSKEFIPTSNRQIFCSKDCCYQARQDEKKADREAERGNHYYRQRECAVCGNSYWPTHSQQKYCSEECQKESHNKKSLEFYHHKREKEKLQCKDLSQTRERVSDMNLSEIITTPA